MIAQAQKGVKMAKYIDLDLAIDEIQKNKCGDLDYDCGIDVALAELKTMPAADVVERKKGKIIIRSNMLDGEDCYCSECDHWGLMPDYQFCPYCGADMRGEP